MEPRIRQQLVVAMSLAASLMPKDNQGEFWESYKNIPKKKSHRQKQRKKKK